MDGVDLMRLVLRLLIGVIIVLGIYLFGIASPNPDSPLGSVFVVLFPSTVILGFILRAAEDRQAREKRKELENCEPRLKGDPLEATREILAEHANFELLDYGTGNSLGKISRASLELLIKVYEDVGMGSNDFLILAETIPTLQEYGASTELVQLIENAPAEDGLLIIRWVI